MKVDINNRINDKFNFKIDKKFPNKNLLIEVTNICNNSCIFCANRKMTRNKGFIDFNFAKRILQECYSLGTREVGFYATGEPLIYDKLPKLIRFAHDIGYEYIYITTNGLLATETKIKELLDAGLNSIKFSINAMNQSDYLFVHGIDAFQIVMNNLKICRELQKTYKNKLFVSCILTKYTNYNRQQVIDFFKDLCDGVSIQNARNQGGLMPLINEKLLISNQDNTQNHKIPCSYVFNAVTITYEGYLTACCMDFQNYLAYADLNKISIKDAWNNNIIEHVRRCQELNDAENTLCKSCVFGKIDNIVPLCEDLSTTIDEDILLKDEEMERRIKSKINKGDF